MAHEQADASLAGRCVSSERRDA